MGQSAIKPSKKTHGDGNGCYSQNVVVAEKYVSGTPTISECSVPDVAEGADADHAEIEKLCGKHHQHRQRGRFKRIWKRVPSILISPRSSLAPDKKKKVTKKKMQHKQEIREPSPEGSPLEGSPRSSISFSSSSLNGSPHDSFDQPLDDHKETEYYAAPNRKRAHGNQIGLENIISCHRATGSLGTNIVHIEHPFGVNIDDVYSGCTSGPVLGHGKQGLVRLIEHCVTGVRFALKRIELEHITDETSLKQLREEIEIMCELDHPNIVRLEEVYEGHNTIYLVQELCVGGELFDQLDEQDDQHYTEKQCGRLVRQMLSSVRYLHSKGIVHRDLKLENFLFSDINGEGCLKMIDFGLSKHFSYPGEKFHDCVGTPYTVAPEVIVGTHDEKCDVWGIGVITYLLLSGDAPFGGCGGPEPLSMVRENILSGLIEFHPEYIWTDISQNARAFVSSLLVVDPTQRPSAEEAQHHNWLKAPGSGSAGARIHPSVVRALLAFRNYSDMRRMLCEVLSYTMMPEQIVELRTEFEKLDTEGTGEITLDGFRRVLLDKNGPVKLAEHDILNVFDALRVCKKETTVHYREFIAAGLSQCHVDDRNLRLAFDRLDSDHKGYVNLRDFLDMMGCDADEGSVRSMFADSLKACQCSEERLYYKDFLRIMKGHTMDVVTSNVGEDSSTFAKADTPQPKIQSIPSFPTELLDNDSEKLAAMGEIYRAHLLMRDAVNEASRRFDKALEARSGDDKKLGRKGVLVMRRGFKNLSTEHVTQTMDDSFSIVPRKNLSRDNLVREASHRSGRPDHECRKKIVSDLSIMLGSVACGDYL